MADQKDVSPLSVSIMRGLTDKLVERRKGAALELERMVKDLVMLTDYGQIKQVISTLEHEFTLSSNPNSRKGGLVGLAATAIALGRTSIGMNLPELVQPVLTCFEDPDARVRYYACESLYNISKVARGAVLVFFNDIFNGLCKLSCDSDTNVRYGTELLDRLMKDVVSENPHFDIDNFIVLLRDRIYTRDGFARQFLVSWIQFLDSVPDIHMHEHVQEFIDGLFCILGDERKEIRRMTEDTLGELLKEIEAHSSTVRFEAMANIIAVHSQTEEDLIQFTALTWMKTFLGLAQRSMMGFTANFLVSILPCVAYDSSKAHIRDVAFDVNDRLKNLILPEDDNDVTTDVEDRVQGFTGPRLSPPSRRKAADETGRGGGGGASGVGGQPQTTTSKNSPKLAPKLSPKVAAKVPKSVTPANTAAASSSSSTTTPTTDAASGQSNPKTGQSSPKTGQKEEGPSMSSSPGDVSTTTTTAATISILDLSPESPKLHLLSVLGVLIPHTKYSQQESRMESLRWLMWLHQQLPKRVYKQASKLFPPLLDMLHDQVDKVVRMALQVVSILSSSKGALEVDGDIIKDPSPSGAKHSDHKGADSGSKFSSSKGQLSRFSKASSTSAASATKAVDGGGGGVVVGGATGEVTPLNKYFRTFLVELLRMFETDRSLLDNKGSFVIRQLCVYVDAHSVYCTLAEILSAEDNLGFSSLMVQVLNMILFTSAELYDFRMQLKDLATPENWSLFKTLYLCWCHNPVATVALCLLTQNYDHASSLVQKFADIEITAGILKEIDRLVQLIESPIFSFLRLQLLVPNEHTSLVRTLYGLLMLLPQSAAFRSLKERLSCVPVIMEVEQESKTRRKRPHRNVPSYLSFDELLEHFVSLQRKHSEVKRQANRYSYRERTNAYST